MAAAPTEPRPPHVAGRIATLRRGLEGMIGVPATEGNSVEVLRNGNEIFPAMLDSIAGAQRTVDLERPGFLGGLGPRRCRPSGMLSRPASTPP